MNLPLAVVDIWFFLNIKLWLPVWTGSKGQLGSPFCKYYLTINDLYNGATFLNLPLAVVEIWFFLNIKLWFIVIRYLMTSSWRHKFCIIYLLCSKYMPSFKFVWNLQNVFFCRQSITKKTIFSICFCRLRATNSITVPPAGLFYMPRPLHSLLRTCVNFHGKCVSLFTKMSCFQSK